MPRFRNDRKFRNSEALTPESLGVAMHTLMTKIVQELKETASMEGQERLFFPQGIQRIHVVLTIGQKDAPIAGIEVDVSGQKSVVTYGGVKEEIINPNRRPIRVCEDDGWGATSPDYFKWVNTRNADVVVQADPNHLIEWPFVQSSPITVHPGQPVDCDIPAHLHGPHRYEVVGCGRGAPRTVIIS